MVQWAETAFDRKNETSAWNLGRILDEKPRRAINMNNDDSSKYQIFYVFFLRPEFQQCPTKSRLVFKVSTIFTFGWRQQLPGLPYIHFRPQHSHQSWSLLMNHVLVTSLLHWKCCLSVHPHDWFSLRASFFNCVCYIKVMLFDSLKYSSLSLSPSTLSLDMKCSPQLGTAGQHCSLSRFHPFGLIRAVLARWCVSCPYHIQTILLFPTYPLFCSSPLRLLDSVSKAQSLRRLPAFSA